ncbi:MAG: hypothetical protein N3A54_00655 [Patescibacteria group bacterium]|nr:hypothetical protein [Patescibacteria group bacterium]
MSYYILDILNKANSIEDDQARANYLKPYMIFPLKIVLASFFNDKIKYDSFRKLKFKKGKPFGSSLYDGSLEVQVKKLYIFREDNKEISYEKKKEILVKTLELLSEEEQTLFLQIIRKENVYKNIGKVFIRKYFPEILEFDMKRP